MARRKRLRKQRPGNGPQTPVEDVTAVEEPVVEEASVEEAITEEPVAEEASVEEAITEEPVAEEPVPEEPVAEEASVEEAITEEPVAEEPAPTATTAADEPAVDVEASPAAYGPPAASVPDVDHGEPAKPRGHVEGAAAWRRIFRMGSPRATKGNLLGAVLAVALGVGIATQVQLTNERGLSELSQPELIRLLDDISARSNRLDQQVRELEITRDRLLGGTASTGEALEQAQRRADTLGILAGTLGARGPGITVSISDPDRAVSGPVILDLIQELRDAGAESIEVGGVRVVASSYVGDSGGELSIDGTTLERPIIVKAIGDSNTLASAMTIPGGIVETIRQEGANATVKESTSIAITSLHTPTEPVHAVPSQ